MLVDVTRQLTQTVGAGDALPSWITPGPGGLSVCGDDTLERETFVVADSAGVRVATSLPEIADSLLAEDKLRTSESGVSHMLGTGFVPLPLTIYDAVLRVGAGDIARVSGTESEPEISITNDYPWLAVNSRQDQSPSTERLHEAIVSSLERQLAECNGDGMLMLSSGKDSVAVAIALADLGYDVPCVTYQAHAGDSEPEHAAAFCRKLGLRHRVVDLPDNPATIRRTLTTFFERAVAPCADHAMIPYIVSIAASGVESGGIIDGGGNDGYMGYVPSGRRQKKRRYRIRGPMLQNLASRLTRIDSRINYLARSRSAAAWPGRNMRYHEIRPVYSAAVDPAAKWRAVDRELAGMHDIDRAMVNMIRQIEGARTPEKARLAAQSRGMRAVFPYCDAELAEYYFHLPLDQRYDVEAHTDKILLRKLLAERIGYDAAVVGDRFFTFDGASFFSTNTDFVRDEINSCELWEPSVGPLVDRWLAALPQRPFLFHPLLSLFMTSGWYNHSPYRKTL